MSTVHVSNIAPSTSEKELREFFSFCGKITSLSITPGATEGTTQSASVTFERETAAKTALLLDNTTLGPSSVKVEATSSLDEIAGTKATGHSSDETDRENEIQQEDKPRTAILAEYLSHGYVIGDQALQKGKSTARAGLARSLSATAQKNAAKRNVSVTLADPASRRQPSASVRLRLLHMLAESPEERQAILAQYPDLVQTPLETSADNHPSAGIALDKQHGISSRFTTTLNKALVTIDSKLHATDRAKAVDSSYKVTERAASTQKSFFQYFEKALSTPTGLKIRHFYEQGEKQVLDIHNEAKRLADLRKQEAVSNTESVEGQSASAQAADALHDAAQNARAAAPATGEKSTIL